MDADNRTRKPNGALEEKYKAWKQEYLGREDIQDNLVAAMKQLSDGKLLAATKAAQIGAVAEQMVFGASSSYHNRSFHWAQVIGTYFLNLRGIPI